jgi:hypothetical protein
MTCAGAQAWFRLGDGGLCVLELLLKLLSVCAGAFSVVQLCIAAWAALMLSRFSDHGSASNFSISEGGRVQ